MVAERVLEYCEQEHISIRELEKRCGLSNGLIGKSIKNGYEVSLPTLKKISEGTGIPIEKLAG